MLLHNDDQSWLVEVSISSHHLFRNVYQGLPNTWLSYLLGHDSEFFVT